MPYGIGLLSDNIAAKLSFFFNFSKQKFGDLQLVNVYLLTRTPPSLPVVVHTPDIPPLFMSSSFHMRIT